MIKRKIWLTVCLIVLLYSGQVAACTLFAATGADRVAGGGTLINKNRDWRPEPQSLRLVLAKEENSFAYYGLFAGAKPALKAGINERGLVVVSATAGTIPKAERLRMSRGKVSILRTLLSRCSSVEQALAEKELFVGPCYIMLADNKEIAYIEIGPEGKYAVRRTNDGVLYHTNCYVEPEMLWANQRAEGKSSRIRYDRIATLMESAKKPLGLEDFITFAQEREAGADNSIWRVGSKPDGNQTLAAFTVYLPISGSPILHVKIRESESDKGQEKVVVLEADSLFAVAGK